MVRNKLDSTIDSLLSAGKVVELELEKTKRKLSDIPGRYNKVPEDSLAKIMNERWKKRN
jgi:hypothetical protein